LAFLRGFFILLPRGLNITSFKFLLSLSLAECEVKEGAVFFSLFSLSCVFIFSSLKSISRFPLFQTFPKNFLVILFSLPFLLLPPTYLLCVAGVPPSLIGFSQFNKIPHFCGSSPPSFSLVWVPTGSFGIVVLG